jgi:lysophospholipase L1-like esterase
MHKLVIGASAAALLLLGSLAVQPSVAHAAAPSYVALGDSYSSGVGTRSYLPDGSTCQRSAYAYPSLVAAARGYALNLRACSGAKVADVRRTQLSALSAATSYVTISVGGNDAGFTGVLSTCAEPGWSSSCNHAIDRAQAYINGTLPASVSALYTRIRAASPSAKVVVVGYPRVFNGQDCNALTWFSPSEESRLNRTADLLNSRLSAAAARAGFGYANPTARFAGHAVCDGTSWINGFANPVTESYHPNRWGQGSGYTPLVSAKLTGGAVAATAATVSAARASGGRLARQQSAYAVRDASITPERFVLPDLHGRWALAADRRAGVDVEHPAGVAAAGRR